MADAEHGHGRVFSGFPLIRRLLDEDLANLPEVEQRHEPVVVTRKHDRLRVGWFAAHRHHPDRGVARCCSYGGCEALLGGGGAFDVVARRDRDSARRHALGVGARRRVHRA